MKIWKLLGRGSAVAACAATIKYSSSFIDHGNSMNTAGVGVALSTIALTTFGAITVGQDIIREVVPGEES